MNYYLLLRRADSTYLLAKAKPTQLCYLGYFLTDDVERDALGFLEWFKNPANSAGSGNATDYSVDEGIMTIIPEWKPDYDECIRQGHYFSIKFDLVLEILRQWGPVYQSRPPYIIITIIDDAVEVRGAETCVDEAKDEK